MEKKIHVNLIGYDVNGEKLAIFANGSGDFFAYKKGTSKPVFTGKSKKKQINNNEVVDEASGDMISYLDFSSLCEEGEYYISSGEITSSYFSIGGRRYHEVKNGLLKGFYYQRCGVSLEKDYASHHSHDICHDHKGRLYKEPSIMLDITGGWHDAGDYGRYVTAGAVAVYDLLLSYERFPQVFCDNLGIPESNNKVPDILDEARVELEWLLKMQNKTSGGVYHKATSKYFCGMIMPEDDKEEIYVFDESVVATGDFAAVMAMGYKIFKEYDLDFANIMLHSSRKAYEWLMLNHNLEGFKNPKDCNTGEYGDKDSRDEIFFAAVLLYEVTMEETYHEYIKANYQTSMDKVSLGWASVGGYASFAYLYLGMKNPTIIDKEVLAHLNEAVQKQADEYVKIASKDGYKVPLDKGKYRWGSNMELMNGAEFLILTYGLYEREEYLEVIKNSFHYILGRNPMGLSYVTGFGSRSVNNIHHRPSSADGINIAVPGLLSGGPNRNKNDELVKRVLDKDTPPAKCFIDLEESYSTNEVAIYWNSPAVFVAAFMDSITVKGNLTKELYCNL